MIPVLVMLLLSILTPSIETSTLENEDQTQATSGRQGSLDVDCSGYTFEDLFEYDFAHFNLDINDGSAGYEASCSALVISPRLVPPWFEVEGVLLYKPTLKVLRHLQWRNQ